MLEPAHIVGVSKRTYVPATPRRLDLGHDLRRTGTNGSPPYPIKVCGRRRLRVLLCGMLALLLLVVAAFSTVHQQLNDTPAAQPRPHAQEGSRYLSTISWPQQGQGALVLDDGRPKWSPHEQPAPIASVAKVMTAYLVLKRYPLSGLQDGFTITVTTAQAQAEAQDAAEGGSVVAVRAGEKLTERQLLEALLIPSGNNIARMLATLIAGSETRFLAEMNAEARALGMGRTIYTDPSGFDPSTASTAADQVRLFQHAMRFQVFREVVSTASVTLPVAGVVRNFNPLIAEGYGGKTGSDAAAGGCLAFFTHVTIGGRRHMAIGVVLGQGEGSETSAVLAAAAKAAMQLVDSVAPANSARFPGRSSKKRAGGAGACGMRGGCPSVPPLVGSSK